MPMLLGKREQHCMILNMEHLEVYMYSVRKDYVLNKNVPLQVENAVDIPNMMSNNYDT